MEDHRRTDLVTDLADVEGEPLAFDPDLLHALAHLRHELDLLALLELGDRRLQDDEGHRRQIGQRLVAMDPPLEVDLADARQPDAVHDVHQQPELDRVAGEEWHRLEQLAAAGVLAGQRLDDAGQLGEEQVDERPRRELGHAAALAGLPLPIGGHQGPVVEALDVLDPRLAEERAQQPVNEARLDVPDVGVHPDHDVAAQLVQALPQRLALARVAAQLGQDLVVLADRYAQLAGDLDRPIGRGRVDDQHLVHEWDSFHERVADAADDEADGLLLVQGGQSDADRQARRAP